MSLVAAAKFDDLPFLIGDCMVSRPGKPNTRTLRRKIVRLSRNLVVGWVGNAIGAENIFDNFNSSSLSGRDFISKDEFEHFLVNCEGGNFGNLQTQLIGWVVDEQAHAFRWRTDDPSEVYFQDGPVSEGSGEDDFLPVYNYIALDETAEASVRSSTPINKIYSILTRLYCEFQLRIHKLREVPLFGIAYEAVFWDGQSFNYLDSSLNGA